MSQSKPNPYERDYEWPTNLYEETYDMGLMASMAYTMGYLIDASRKAQDKGIPFIGMDNDPNSDKSITNSSASDPELKRSFTAGEIKDIVVKNKEFLASIVNDFEGATLERLIDGLDQLQAKTDASGIERALALEEFDDRYQEDECVYAVTRDSVSKRITVIFRGTEMNLGAKVAIKNWMGNFNIFKKSVHVPEYLKDKMGIEKLKFHTGFHDYIFNETKEAKDADGTRKYDQILSDVKSIIAKYPDHNVYVTGYSLGAALSTITAFYLACEDDETVPKPVSNINFGSPRVGGWRVSEAVHCLEKGKQLRVLRSINENDNVTTLPHGRFYHVGHQITCYTDGWFKKNIAPEFIYMNPKSSFFSRWSKYRTNSIIGNLNLSSDHNIGDYLKRIVQSKPYLEKKSLNQMYLDNKVFE